MGVMPIEDLIQIHLEDLVLAITPFNAVRQNDFAQLPPDRPFPGQKQRAGDLLGNRAGPFAHLSGTEVYPNGSEHSQQVDATMRIKSGILDGNCRLQYRRGHLVQRHEKTPLDKKIGDQFTMPRVDFRH